MIRRSTPGFPPFLLAVFLTALPCALHADERGALERRGTRARAILDVDAQARRVVQREYRERLAAYAAARERSDRVEREARPARRRLRSRGEKRANAEARIAAASAELAQAESDLQAFRKRAVQGGAKPGWLAAVEEELGISSR